MPVNQHSGFEPLNTVAVLGNYLPRLCGIATFTTDLCEAMARVQPQVNNIIALAMDDVEGGYLYPKRVKFQLRTHIPGDYLRAADFLNINHLDMLIVQHEYGIFGGEYGAHIFHLLRNVNMPVITTLHTVLAEPAPKQRAVILELADCSEQLIVMATRAKQMLIDIYGIPESRITLIPHGIHDVPFVDSSFYKDKFYWQDRKVVLTFGLLGPGKGLEVMIEAMPDIVAAHPDVLYVILGATHPHILRESGEKYRHGLHNLVRSLNLDSHVVFHNQFVDLESLKEYINAADVYVTPYLSREQITSGTLAYAVGSGKAVVSTPYWYAEELLAEDRGLLVDFGDTAGFVRSVNELLNNDVWRNAMRKRAYLFGRSMAWEKVGRDYLTLASEVLTRRRKKSELVQANSAGALQFLDEMPKVNLTHLRTLTDDTGILQHAFFTIPDRENGYCVDDNARALIAGCLHYKLLGDETVVPLIKTYLAFLYHAFNTEAGQFRNFMSYDRQWRDEIGSEDANGRALWGLGIAAKNAPNKTLQHSATRLFSDSVGVVEQFAAPRAWAFGLLGLNNYLDVFEGDATVRSYQILLADRLLDLFHRTQKPDWPWFEEIVTYSNGVLPQALLLTGRNLDNQEMVDVGEQTLRWLLEQQTAPDGYLSLIGNDNWLRRRGTRSNFDQQPVEMIGLIQACGEAFRCSGDSFWLNEAKRCLGWFLGRNDLETPLYDYQTGGCCDGLHPTGVNANQGAESTLAWLISLMEMHNMLADEILVKRQMLDLEQTVNAKSRKKKQTSVPTISNERSAEGKH